eukprot:Awhi_evm1s13208
MKYDKKNSFHGFFVLLLLFTSFAFVAGSTRHGCEEIIVDYKMSQTVEKHLRSKYFINMYNSRSKRNYEAKMNRDRRGIKFWEHIKALFKKVQKISRKDPFADFGAKYLSAAYSKFIEHGRLSKNALWFEDNVVKEKKVPYINQAKVTSCPTNKFLVGLRGMLRGDKYNFAKQDVTIANANFRGYDSPNIGRMTCCFIREGNGQYEWAKNYQDANRVKDATHFDNFDVTKGEIFTGFRDDILVNKAFDVNCPVERSKVFDYNFEDTTSIVARFGSEANKIGPAECAKLCALAFNCQNFMVLNKGFCELYRSGIDQFLKITSNHDGMITRGDCYKFVPELEYSMQSRPALLNNQVPFLSYYGEKTVQND